MNNAPIYVDEIMQVFESNGTRHLILGASSGEVNGSGSDVCKPVLHLVISESRVEHIATLIQQALYADTQGEESGEAATLAPESQEEIGSPLFIFK